MRRAVFLDRDGTLVEEAGYVDRLERLVLFPYSVDAVRLLNRAGFAVVVATSQSGVARGIVPEEFVREAHRHLSDRLALGGARLDGLYYCPHLPDAAVARYRLDCACRKPLPGLLQAAARDLHLDLAKSFVVGDRRRDVEAGIAAGARAVLVRTGYGRGEETQLAGVRPHAVADNLVAAVSWILGAA